MNKNKWTPGVIEKTCPNCEKTYLGGIEANSCRSCSLKPDNGELKPCPFCGGSVGHYKSESDIDYGDFIFHCDKCGIIFNQFSRDESEAITAWNKRAGAKLLSLAITEMRQAIIVRVSFIGHPNEPMNSAGPDWSNELPMLDALEKLAKSME